VSAAFDSDGGVMLPEKAESERLRQIIKELQRHRFGRRSLIDDRLADAV
jgi:hypothetical protein